MTPFIFWLIRDTDFNQVVDEDSISMLLGLRSNIGLILMLLILGLFCCKAIKNNHINKEINLSSQLMALGVIGILCFV